MPTWTKRTVPISTCTKRTIPISTYTKPRDPAYLLNEDGSYLLNENGTKILLQESEFVSASDWTSRVIPA